MKVLITDDNGTLLDSYDELDRNLKTAKDVKDFVTCVDDLVHFEANRIMQKNKEKCL